MIPDSYGTHAADTEMLAACLRHAFVERYKNNDVLANFREEIVQLIGPDQAKELPPIPAKGSLDLDQVKESTFFFA
jgi:DNA-directed RNA polymerase